MFDERNIYTNLVKLKELLPEKGDSRWLPLLNRTCLLCLSFIMMAYLLVLHHVFNTVKSYHRPSCTRQGLLCLINLGHKLDLYSKTLAICTALSYAHFCLGAWAAFRYTVLDGCLPKLCSSGWKLSFSIECKKKHQPSNTQHCNELAFSVRIQLILDAVKS